MPAAFWLPRAGKHEANNDGVIQFKLMRKLGDPACVTVHAPGYSSYNTFSVPRDGKEHSYVLLTKEELSTVDWLPADVTVIDQIAKLMD